MIGESASITTACSTTHDDFRRRWENPASHMPSIIQTWPDSTLGSDFPVCKGLAAPTNVCPHCTHLEQWPPGLTRSCSSIFYAYRDTHTHTSTTGSDVCCCQMGPFISPHLTECGVGVVRARRWQGESGVTWRIYCLGAIGRRLNLIGIAITPNYKLFVPMCFLLLFGIFSPQHFLLLSVWQCVELVKPVTCCFFSDWYCGNRK